MIVFDLLADIALTRIQNPTAKIVLLSIASYCNDAGECYPSQATLAKDSCMTDRSVRNAIAWLVEHGYLEVQPRPNTSNLYIITSMKEDDMDHEEKFSYEEGNITKLDISKKTKSNLTSSPEKFSASPTFELFWSIYPKKRDKGHARLAFRKHSKVTDPAIIIAGAQKYAAFVRDTGVEFQFIPYASTWLNGERWDDDLESETKTNWGSALDGL